MFYEGDLQSGIALAVSQGKLVLCFVRDDGEESSVWQDNYLADEEISQLISSTSVLLRLEGGSQEAGFLASFCPIKDVPLLVAIKNGRLQEYITKGVDEEKFKRRLKAVLQAPSTSDASQQQQVDESTTPAPPQNSIPTPATAVSDLQTNEAETEDRTAAERTRRDSIRAGKRRAETSTETTPQAPETSKSPQKEWKAQQRKREQHEKSERERVLNQIRQDHEDRRQREEQRRLAAAEIQRQSNTQNPAQQTQQRKQASGQFRLQVRLFDGTSIRSTFQPTQTISGDVRSWIDSRRSDGDMPYTLKHILNPLPNRTLSISEEDQTLSELGLGPTASLVMVPVQTYTEAYAAAGSYLPVRGLYAGYSLVTGAVGSVAGAVGSFLGFGQGAGTPSPNTASDTSNQPDGSSTETTGASPRNMRSGRTNVRTLFDGASDQQPNQFYNGNQLNFEPRSDKGDK